MENREKCSLYCTALCDYSNNLQHFYRKLDNKHLKKHEQQFIIHGLGRLFDFYYILYIWKSEGIPGGKYIFSRYVEE